MRTPIHTISPLILYWSMLYVLALLSLYTYIAGFLARNREAARTPAKPIRSSRGLSPEQQPSHNP
jgi:hypothetical protein